MKVAITGHTSGIGKELFNLFSNPIGFSRSTGHDISDPEKRKIIIDSIVDCDVFINNAHSGMSQVELLFGIWEKWKTLNKTIVNISSLAGDLTFSNFSSKQYVVHKNALDIASSNLAFQFGPCKVINIRPDYVDTPMVQKINSNKMDPKELAQFIKFIIDYSGTFWVHTVTLYKDNNGIAFRQGQ